MEEKMSAAFVMLVAEFERVLKCPYPTQLRTLYDIVCTRCTTADIERWVREYRCRLTHVARILLEGLQQWPYVGEIIACLSACVLFRNAVVILQPRFLDNVLEQAMQMENLNEPAASLAVTMISHPLPEECLLPARVQTFFLRLMERATAHPTMATVKPLLDVLRGTSTLLLGLLTQTSMLRFEEQLFSILRSSTIRSEAEQEESCLTLYCLAIMKIVAEASDEHLKLTTSSFDTQDLLASTQAEPQKWNADAMRKFFTKPKTLQLLVLRVMDAVRSSDNRALESQIKVVLLSNDLLRAIPLDLRISWCSGNRSLLQRLEQKAISADSDKELQLQVLAFLYQLPLPEHTSKQFAKLAHQMLAQADNFTRLSTTAATEAVINLVAGSADSESMPVLFQTMLNTLSYGAASEVVRLSSVYARLLNHIKATIKDEPKRAEVVTSAVTSEPIASRLQIIADAKDLSQAWTTQMRSGLPICSVVWQNAYSTVIHTLADLLLSSAMAVNNTRPDVPSATADVLLKLHSAHPKLVESCIHTKENAQVLVTDMIDQIECQQPSSQAQDWKGEVSALLAARHYAEHEQIGRILQRACADLETRCDTAEEPFRKEQMRCKALQEDYNELSKAYSELEMHNISVDMRQAALEKEKSELLYEVKDARKRADSLISRTKEFEQMMKDSKDEANREMNEYHSAVEIIKLEHAAILARMQEALDEARNGEDASRETLKVKINAIQSMEVELCGAKTIIQGLINAKETLEGSLNNAHEQVAMLEASSRAKEDRCSELESSLTSIRARSIEQEESHSRQLQQIQDHAQQVREQNNTAHHATIEQLTVQNDSEIDRHKQQLVKLGSELDEANARHANAIAKRDEELAEMEQEIERVRRRCRQKDDQITQANHMRTNLMVAMGIPQDSEAPASKLEVSIPHRHRPTSTRGSTLQPPSPANSTTPHEQQHQDRAEHFFTSSHSSHEQSGPTPKRARPRPSIKRTTAKSRSHTKPSRQTSSTSRQPLMNLSVNKSPRKSGLQPLKLQRQSLRHEDLCPSDEEEEGEADEESTFVGSDIFTGTAAQAEVDEILLRQAGGLLGR